MSGDDPFERSLRALHDAAFDDALWPVAAALLDEACGSKGNMLFSGGGTPADIDTFFARYCHRGQHRPDREREYFEVWYPLDERIARMRHLPDSRIVHVHELITDEERRRSAVYNELLGAWDGRNGLHVLLDGPGGSSIGWNLLDPVDGDGWTPARLDTIGRLLPHLRQFVRVREALAGARALGASALALLDHAGAGVIGLDPSARITAVNDRARALLNARDGLSDPHRCLRASRPREDRRLRHLIARALPGAGQAGAGGSMPVPRAAPRPPLALHVSPVSEGAAHPPRSPFGALVLVVDPEDRPGLDPDLVGEALGLTPAESRVAVLLAEGRTIDDVAARLGRSRTTVKWHIANIYDKHGLTRQVELAQLVMPLADAWRFRA